MNDKDALIQEKNGLIQKMLEMQKQFIAYEHQHGISGKDYWAAENGLLVNYREEYAQLATRVVDLAHAIVGSSRR